MTSLCNLLALETIHEFMDRYFLQIPYISVYGAKDWSNKFGWRPFFALASTPQCDVLVTSGGQPLPIDPPFTAEQLALYLDGGGSIRVRRAQLQTENYFQVAHTFHQHFGSPIDCQVYGTSANSVGLHWHYDAEDVFILQVEGTKTWRLRKNTVQPWPLIETLPEDMHLEQERSPAFEHTLRPGSWMYIPSGYWHSTHARERSLSISVGVRPPTAIDFLNFVRSRFVKELPWRQRIPITGQPGGDAQDRQIMANLNYLGREFARQFASTENVQSFLSYWRAVSSPAMSSELKEGKTQWSDNLPGHGDPLSHSTSCISGD